MGLFDDIVPPDSAPSDVATPPGVPRITVRPKGVEPPPGPGNAGGLFDDIVPSARTGGLFDDIVPPADAPASDLPEPEGGQFAAPLPDGRNFRVAREGISPPAGFVDRLATMWENPPKDRPSLIGLIKSAYEVATLPGDVYSGKTPTTSPDGHTSDEVIARAKDLAQVYPLRSAPGGMFGRSIKDRVANPFPKAERALSDEAAAAPRGTVAPTVPPATPRQILAPEQGVPIPRSGPQPPRPPDKAVAQSDRMNSGARESGPFSLEGTERHALSSGRRPHTLNNPRIDIPQVTAKKKVGDDFRDKPAAAGGRSPFGIGVHAGESIPARSAARNFTAAERAAMNRIGAKTGCHTCGTKNPGTKYENFVPDHQPPSALNRAGGLQRLYPHCKGCSDAQGLGIIRLLRRLRGPR
jgi:hypothetical protein